MRSEQINQLAKALAVAQGQIKNPPRNQKVTVVTRTGGKYEFQYADLDAIIDAIKKPLSDNGISYIQYVEQVEEKFRLVTTLMHESGQWVSAINPLFLTSQKDRDGNILPPSSQDFGSAQTFMKRYALAAMTGVAADTDDDANMADGNAAKFTPRVPDSAPAIKPPSKAAAALVEIAAGKNNGEVLAPQGGGPDGRGERSPEGTKEEMTGQAWRRFGEQMVKLYKEGKEYTPEQKAKLLEMQTARPKMYENLLSAIAEAPKASEVPPQPKPDNDPDAYRVWLIERLSKFDKRKDVDEFYSYQHPLWEKCFPPDIEDWAQLFDERRTELK